MPQKLKIKQQQINNKARLQKMGGVNLSKPRSLQKFFPNFRVQDWIEVSPSQTINQSKFGEYITLKNRQTNQWIDKYELLFNSDRQQRIYEQCFMQRLRQQYLVNAFHYQPLKSKGICSNVKGAYVYIQHIPIRLCDVTDIPFQESLYIMRCALLGFQKLYNQSGYFAVMEEHVGIDKSGHTRVWLNADLSKNYPYSAGQQTHQSRDYERIMVNQIISIIQKNTNFQTTSQLARLSTQTSKQYLPISNFMQANHSLHASFKQAQQLIHRYINTYQIKIPRKCTSVVEIIQETYGEQFNVTNASNFTQRLNVFNPNQRLYQPSMYSQEGSDANSSKTINFKSNNNNNLKKSLGFSNSRVSNNINANYQLQKSMKNNSHRQSQYSRSQISRSNYQNQDSRITNNINRHQINNQNFKNSSYNSNKSQTVSKQKKIRHIPDGMLQMPRLVNQKMSHLANQQKQKLRMSNVSRSNSNVSGRQQMYNNYEMSERLRSSNASQNLQTYNVFGSQSGQDRDERLRSSNVSGSSKPSSVPSKNYSNHNYISNTNTNQNRPKITFNYINANDLNKRNYKVQQPIFEVQQNQIENQQQSGHENQYAYQDSQQNSQRYHRQNYSSQNQNSQNQHSQNQYPQNEVQKSRSINDSNPDHIANYNLHYNKNYRQKTNSNQNQNSNSNQINGADYISYAPQTQYQSCNIQGQRQIRDQYHIENQNKLRQQQYQIPHKIDTQNHSNPSYETFFKKYSTNTKKTHPKTNSQQIQNQFKKDLQKIMRSQHKIQQYQQYKIDELLAQQEYDEIDNNEKNQSLSELDPEILDDLIKQYPDTLKTSQSVA